MRELLLRAPLRPRRVVAAALHELARGACVRTVLRPYCTEAVRTPYLGRTSAVLRPYFGRTRVLERPVGCGAAKRGEFRPAHGAAHVQRVTRDLVEEDTVVRDHLG